MSLSHIHPLTARAMVDDFPHVSIGATNVVRQPDHSWVEWIKRPDRVIEYTVQTGGGRTVCFDSTDLESVNRICGGRRS